SKDTVYGNYTISDGHRDTPQADTNFIQLVPIRNQSFSMTETRVVSAAIVNSAILGFARTYATQVQNPTVPFASNLIFLPGGNPGSIVIGGGATTVAPAAITPA